MAHKRITCKADLAVNGAAPAFDEPLHVGRPNVGSREEFMRLAGEMFDRRWFTNNGPLVQQFEQRVAAYLGVRNCVAMCNGTIALEIAIRALKLEGEVIVPSWTFVATAHALYWQGITPVFADIDPVTHNLDPDAVRRMITPRTTGIIGVHLWGRAAPVEELQAIADEHGLQLMFDAAHAFGCSYKGQTIGRFGRAEVLSFHATKFFNTLEGGAIVTDDDELAGTMRLMRNFGFVDFDKVVHPGTNGKMIEVCAAMGLANFDSMGDTITANMRNYHAYRTELAGIEGISVVAYDDSEHSNFHYIVLEVDPLVCNVHRDQIVAALHAEKVLARKYFWPGCHNMQPYKSLFPHVGLIVPHTEKLADKIVVLPNGTSVDLSTISVIASVIKTLASAAA